MEHRNVLQKCKRYIDPMDGHFQLALHQLFYSNIVAAKRTTQGCSCLLSWLLKLSGTANATGLALALDLLASSQARQFQTLEESLGHRMPMSQFLFAELLPSFLHKSWNQA